MQIPFQSVLKGQGDGQQSNKDAVAQDEDAETLATFDHVFDQETKAGKDRHAIDLALVTGTETPSEVPVEKPSEVLIKDHDTAAVIESDEVIDGPDRGIAQTPKDPEVKLTATPHPAAHAVTSEFTIRRSDDQNAEKAPTLPAQLTPKTGVQEVPGVTKSDATLRPMQPSAFDNPQQPAERHATPKTRDVATPETLQTLDTAAQSKTPLPPSRLETIATAKMMAPAPIAKDVGKPAMVPPLDTPLNAAFVQKTAPQTPEMINVAKAVHPQLYRAQPAAGPVIMPIEGALPKAVEPGTTREATPIEALSKAQTPATTHTNTVVALSKVSTAPPIAGLAKTFTLSERGPTSTTSTSEVIAWDVRGTTVPTGQATPTMPVRAEMPQHVAHAIAQALHSSPEKNVEIALNPVELGRVRIVMSPSDAGMTVNILADRPETLELMRRNIDDLGRSMSELGYEDINFSFGQDGTSDEASDDDPDRPDRHLIDIDLPNETQNPKTPLTALAIAPDGIDMRL